MTVDWDILTFDWPRERFANQGVDVANLVDKKLSLAVHGREMFRYKIIEVGDCEGNPDLFTVVVKRIL